MSTVTIDDTAGTGPGTEPVWAAATWAVLAIYGVYLVVRVVTLVLLGQDYDLIGRLTANPDPAYLQQLGRQADLGQTWQAVSLAVAWLWLVTDVGWLVSTRRILAGRGQVRRQWMLRARYIALIPFLALAFWRVPQPTGTSVAELRRYGQASDTKLIVLTVAQILFVLLMGMLIWHLRGQVRALLSRPPTMPSADGSVRRGLVEAYRLRRKRRTERVYE